MIPETAARSDANGVVSVRQAKPGDWYVKFVHIVKARGDTTIDDESKWATLTFGVR